MSTMITTLQKLFRDEDGASAVEYAVVVALIIIAAITAVTLFGTNLAAWFTGAAGTVGTLPTS